MNKLHKPFKGEVYPTKSCGPLSVVEYIDFRNVRVRFVLTGFETTVQTATLRTGEIKDRFTPSVHGVGYMGVGPYKCSHKGKLTKIYRTWRSMFRRCYCPIALLRHPTYSECTVSPEWHNFQTFAVWFEEQYTEGYQLDKDIKIKGNKVYSPEACSFVSGADNIIEAQAKHYTFLNPAGVEVEVYNLSEFSKANGLNASHMSQVYLGKATHHKQWKRAA